MSIRVPDSKVVQLPVHCASCQTIGSVEARTPWLALYEKDGYVFSHSPKWKGVAVAIIPFRKVWKDHPFEHYEFLSVIENRPCHGGDDYISSLTGAYDNSGKFSLEQCVLNELAEEGGYIGLEEDLIPLGWVNGSKSSDGIDHLFAIEITEATPTCIPEGDGIETNLRPTWIGEDEILNSRDMILISMYARLQAKL